MLKQASSNTPAPEPCQQRHQPDMDEFGCLFSDRVDAEQFQVVSAEELQKTAGWTCPLN